MTHTEMLKSLIDACEAMFEARKKYDNHPGGGASQKIKNRLANEVRIKNTELGNLVYNVKQFLK